MFARFTKTVRLWLAVLFVANVEDADVIMNSGYIFSSCSADVSYSVFLSPIKIMIWFYVSAFVRFSLPYARVVTFVTDTPSAHSFNKHYQLFCSNPRRIKKHLS